MDPKSYEITNLRILNDYLTQTIEVLARAHRIGLNSTSGLGHTTYGQGVFGQAMMDPRVVDYSVGLGHSSYGVYPYNFGTTQWTGSPMGTLPTFVDPFLAQRGLSHTTGQWTGQWTNLSPYAAAEIARQREFLARQQYEAAMWGTRPFGV